MIRRDRFSAIKKFLKNELTVPAFLNCETFKQLSAQLYISLVHVARQIKLNLRVRERKLSKSLVQRRASSSDHSR